MIFLEKKQYTIIVVFLVNLFFFRDDSTLFYILNFISLAVIIAILFSEEDTSVIQKNKSSPIIDPKPDKNTEKIKIETNTNNLLDRIITLLSEVMRVEGIIFFKYESKTSSLKIEKHKVTDAIISNSKFSMSNEIPGISLKKRKSLLFDKIDNQEILSYYQTVQKDRKELYLKPVFKQGNLFGLFLLDSCDKGAFNESFISVINQIIHIYQENINEIETYKPSKADKKAEHSTNTLKLELYRKLNNSNDEQTFFDQLKTIFPEYFHANNFYIVKETGDTTVKIVSILGNIEEAHLNYEFPFNEGIIGWAIQNNKIIIVDDIINENQFTVRFKQNEKKPEKTRSVLIATMPVKNKFALVFESVEVKHFSNEMKTTLYELSEDIASIYETVIKREASQKHLFYIEYPELLSMTAFNHFFNIWTSLSIEKDLQFSLFSIKLLNNRFLNANQSQIVLKFIIKELKEEISDSDLLFQYNNQQLLLMRFISEKKVVESFVDQISEKINHTRIFAESKTIEPQIIVNVLDNCQTKELNEVLFKLHLEQN
jgi:putative methionine-R-sulfoxide reductase with GAF domain